MVERYDVVCIGAGPGGYIAAIRASQLGKKVAIVEVSKDKIGGTCLNEGCIPVKSIIRNSQLYSLANKSMKEIVDESKKIVSQLRNGVLYLFKKNNITLLEGKARLVGVNEIQIESFKEQKKVIEAGYIILASGSKVHEVPDFNLDGNRIISSREAINLKEIPKSITIIGAGAIGIEFADIFKNFGSSVTLVDIMDRILPQEDIDISRSLERILKKKGVNILTGTKLVPSDINTELILVAVGRKPNISDLGLEEVGVEIKDGFVNVNNYMKTSQGNIFAVGDLIQTPMLAHTAYEEGVIAAEYICGMDPEEINYLNVPMVVYGDTEVASIGFTESAAREKCSDVKVSKHFFKANSRSIINQHPEGFIKIIADSETQALLGVHILGSEASEIIHSFIVAKSAGLSVEELSRIIFAHPTVSEAIKDACKSVFGRPIHG